MKNFQLMKQLLSMTLILLIIPAAWAKNLITPERLAVLSVDFISVDGSSIKQRPCPKRFAGTCPAGVPDSCLMILTPSSLIGTVTITNNSSTITATNVTANTAYLNTLFVFQSPPTGISSIAPGASDVLQFIASGVPISPAQSIEIKGDNTASACFGLLVTI
jgi:hypothetical protein